MIVFYIILSVVIVISIVVKIIQLVKKNKPVNKTEPEQHSSGNKKVNETNNLATEEKPLIMENFSNSKYQKFKETSVPIKKTKTKKEEVIGNLDQCQVQCDTKEGCIGFQRDKIADSATGKCYLISNVVNCHNEYREPSEKYLTGDGISKTIYKAPEKFYEYDTYFKVDVTPAEKDSIQKCIKLNMTTSISPRKYPFSLLVMDENNNLLVMSRDKYVDSQKKLEDGLFYSKYSIFTIVKGLSGKGISWKINKNNSDYYVVKKAEGENLALELEEDSLQFKQNASFIVDLEYAEDETMELNEVKFISIRHEHKGVHLYWQVNEVTQKVVLVNKNKLDKDFEDIMFELKYPLPFVKEEKATSETEEIDVPAPSSEDNVEEEKESEKKNMSEELERLELDIRESQHQQNLKLMNIMLDVNKFKLQDLSMSDYLTKCVRTSEEQETYIDTKIQGENMNQNNTNQNNANQNNANQNTNSRSNENNNSKENEFNKMLDMNVN